MQVQANVRLPFHCFNNYSCISLPIYISLVISRNGHLICNKACLFRYCNWKPIFHLQIFHIVYYRTNLPLLFLELKKLFTQRSSSNNSDDFAVRLESQIHCSSFLLLLPADAFPSQPYTFFLKHHSIQGSMRHDINIKAHKMMMLHLLCFP